MGMSQGLEVRLSPQDQMVLKYLVRLARSGISLDEIALALDHAFTEVTGLAAIALRSLVAEPRNLPVLDETLRGGRAATLHITVGAGGQLLGARHGSR